jgi:hypothetical protein
MKHAGIEVRIGRLVVDASRHSEVAGLADAIGQALHQRLAGSAHGDVPRLIADRVATQLSTTPGAGSPRGKP